MLLNIASISLQRKHFYHGDKDVWIGFTDKDVENHWRWSSGICKRVTAMFNKNTTDVNCHTKGHTLVFIYYTNFDKDQDFIFVHMHTGHITPKTAGLISTKLDM